MAYVGYDMGTTSGTAVWTQWACDTGTAANLISPTATWYHWTSSTTTALATSPYCTWIEQVDQRQKARKETRLQRRAREREQEEQRRLHAEQQRVAHEQQLQREAAQRQAEERAEQLLLSVLTPEQERAWKENRAIFVTGNKTGKRYKIAHGSHGNIKELDAAGKEVASLCVNVPRGLPNHDNVVAQKLMLELHEEELLRRANRTVYR